MCPYGRLQGVLIDDDSLVVGYDQKRGEPRGKATLTGIGDCVDCNRCVVVCPTGIDIRERVPDRIVREADSAVLVDLPVAELQARLREGKIYPPEQAARALENFFRTEMLARLRE